MNTMSKKCSLCHETKNLDLFGNKKDSKDGKASRCKLCTSAKTKEYREKNPERYKELSKKWRLNNPNYIDSWKKRNKNKTKAHKRKEYLKTKYGISVETYNWMREQQEYKCYICDKHENEIANPGPTALNVDHCHTTNKLRKLICMSCNIALGKLNDDIHLFERCIEYIKEHSNGKEI